ncbi:MAG: Zn-ribbon domain-containing OB-fold protein [Proteobacteria bacterium]|nr:Zn-ribbon domain-containing OB-fold protein [Pseudomonadota bacterium]
MANLNDSLIADPGPEAVFRDGLTSGKFIIQKCGDCDSHIFYPRAMCPECGSIKLTSLEASGQGTVYSTSVVRNRPEQGGNFNIAIVELAEGPRLMTRVQDIEPDQVQIGMAVEAFIGAIDDTPVVLFRPAEG